MRPTKRVYSWRRSKGISSSVRVRPQPKKSVRSLRVRQRAQGAGQLNPLWGLRTALFALSIRAARRFAELTLRYAAGDLPVSADPIAAAADTAVGNALDRPVRDALVTYLKTIFGERITELRKMRTESSAPVR